MSQTPRDVMIEVANLAAAVERAAADLALSEEPSGFVTALDAGAGADDDVLGERDAPVNDGPARAMRERLR